MRFSRRGESADDVIKRMAHKERPTFTDLMRIRLRGIIEPLAGFFNRLGILPNTMTLLGLFGNIVGAYFLSQGRMTIGGIVIFMMGSFDALDGTMARLRGESSDWGAFVDSVSDRYSELLTFAGLLVYYQLQGESASVFWVYGAAAGSVLVSYVRARAQSLGFDTKIGLFTRFERYIVLVPSLVFNVPLWGMIIIAVGANLTAFQRIYSMRSQWMQKE